MTEPRVFDVGSTEPGDKPRLLSSDGRWEFRWAYTGPRADGWARYRRDGYFVQVDTWSNHLKFYGPLTEILPESPPTPITGVPYLFTDGGAAVTKSSGTKDEFEGGGVRDAEAGKPRFDLLRPLNVPYGDQLLTRWAALMARGAEHYGDRNWERMSDQKAMDRFRSSAARHFEQWYNREVDEDHAAATLFNIEGAEYVKGILGGLWLPLGATA